MKKTVIILGAGTNVPYGFPTGFDLMKNILSQNHYIFNISQKKYGDTFFSFDKLDDLFNTISLTASENESINKAINIRKNGVEYLQLNQIEFCQSFFSGLKLFRNSQIDYFLRNHNKFKDFGKSVIAREILLKESEANKILEDVDSVTIKEKSDWIGTLLSTLLEQASNPEELIKISQNLTIITFNYDIFFEHYLDLFCKGDGEWGKALEEFKKNLKIIHIYGKLGRLSWETNLNQIYDDEMLSSFVERDDNNKFGFITYNNVPYDIISNLSKGIKVIGGEKQLDINLKHINKARTEINNSEKIFFLGFGFDRNNLNLPGITQDSLSNKKFDGKEVFYSNYNEDEYIELIIRERIKKVEYIDTLSIKAKEAVGTIKNSKDISSLIKLHI